MHLVYTATAYPPSTGGAQFYQHLLAQSLSKNHKIEVVSQWSTNRSDWLLGTTLRAPSKSTDYEIDGIKVHQLGLSPKEKLKLVLPVTFYYPAMQYSIPLISSCLKHHLRPYMVGGDIIHNVRIGREGLSYASYELAREYNIPFVFTPVHHPRWIGWRYKAYIDLYKNADAVIALTHAEKNTLISLGVASDRIFVTGMGPVVAPLANPKRFLDKLGINGPFVLFLGQHYSYKGYLHLLEATHKVWQKIPDTHFVFIGPAVKDSDNVFRSISDRRIHRLGKVDIQEKTDALAACHLLCVPSTQESFGGIYTEAWSFQKPVIGCAIPAVSEVISHDVDGYLVEQNDDKIAEAIVDLLLNPNKANLMGEMGKQKVELRYSWANLARLTEQVYQGLV